MTELNNQKHLFGRDHAQRNALSSSKKTHENLKVTVEGGIRKWLFRVVDFQSLLYILHMLKKAGELLGMALTPLSEMEMQVILNGGAVLNHQCQQELVKSDWNIFAQPLDETIPKLEVLSLLFFRKELMTIIPIAAASSSATNKWKQSKTQDSNPAKKQKLPSTQSVESLI